MERNTETILLPDQAIVDAHHHLWSTPHRTYQTAAFLQDVRSGHRIVATVHVECTQYYRTSGPEALRPLGETARVAAMTEPSVRREIDFPGLAAGIVGHVDFSIGAAIGDVLHQHIALGDGRFRGIRHTAPADDDPAIGRLLKMKRPLLLRDASFREGFACLAPLNLVFDAWVVHPQLDDVLDLARAFPETTIIVNHTGGPAGVGRYHGRRAAVFSVWSKGMTALASAPNVYVKLGGLGMKLGGFDVAAGAETATSDDIATAWQPYIEHCIQTFGPRRCLFESNFPVDGHTCSYAMLWNAFKRLAIPYTAAERHALFAGTAARVYQLDLGAFGVDATAD